MLDRPQSCQVRAWKSNSDFIQELLDEQLSAKFQQPAVAEIMPELFEIYRSAGVLSELGVALVRNLQQLQSPTISEYTADRWLEMWQQLGSKELEMELSLSNFLTTASRNAIDLAGSIGIEED